MYLYHCSGYAIGVNGCMWQKQIFSMVEYVLGKAYFELRNLGVYRVWGSLEMVGEFQVYCLVEQPFFRMYEYGGKSFEEPIVLYVYVGLEASFNTTEVCNLQLDGPIQEAVLVVTLHEILPAGSYSSSMRNQIAPKFLTHRHGLHT